MTFYTIDISGYNGPFNFAAVKAGGIQGVVCKATVGTPAQTFGSTTNYFLNAAAEIKRQGFPVKGGYHWLLNGNYAAQAANFHNTLIQGYGSLNGLTLQLDAEEAGLGLADVQGFVRAWNAISGNYPLCGYFPHWFWSGLGVGASQLLPLVGGRWWQSAYVGGSGSYIDLAGSITSGWNLWGGFSPLILQFTSTSNIPGGTSVCDVNQIKGTVADFLSVATWQPAPPAPPIPPALAEDKYVKLVKEAGKAEVYLTDVSPAGPYRLYVQAAQFGDLVKLYGDPVTVSNLANCGPVVTQTPTPPHTAATERHARRGTQEHAKPASETS